MTNNSAMSDKTWNWKATCMGCGWETPWTGATAAEIVIAKHMSGCEHSDGARELRNRAAQTELEDHR